MKSPAKLGRLYFNFSLGSLLFALCGPFMGGNVSAVCVSPPSGLVSWWRGETNALDQAGTNNGTLAGNTSYGSGRVGQGFVFDGSTDLVTVGNPGSLQLQDFTIETWIKRSSAALVSGGSYGIGVIFGYGQGGYGLIMLPDGHVGLSLIGADVASAGQAILDTGFHHVAVSKSGSSVVVYIDGVAYPTAAYNPTFTFSTIAAIGARGDNLDNSFLGAIDEVSVYNRPLAAGEVQAIYNAGSTGKCAPTSPPFSDGLVAYYPLNGNANDASGNGKHGTALNGVSYVTDVRGTVAYFNGSSQYISLPNSISNYMDLSVTFWLKTSDSNPNAFPSGLFLVSRDIAGYAADWNICLGQGRKIQFLTDANALVPVNDAESNQWVHVACVADAAGQLKTIFLNGQPAASASWSPSAFANNNVPIFLGAATVETASHAFFTGSMADVRFYNRALSVSEVQQVYAYESASSCVAPPSGLVSWWRGESDSLDLAGVNHGTLAGNTTFGPGQVGQGFVFDGNADLVTTGNPTNLQLQDFTIETWIKRGSAAVVSGGSYGIAVIFGYGQGGYGLIMRPDGHVGLGLIGTDAASAGPAIVDTGFHHVAATKLGSTVVVYIDGVAYPTADYSRTFTFSTVAAIGARGDNLDNSFLGVIDEVSVYNRPLAANEIQAIYNAGSAGKCPITCIPRTATATPTVVNGFVVGATITDAGCGYTNAPMVRIIEGGGSGAQAMAVVSNGVVTAINVEVAGSGYTKPPIIVIKPPFIPQPTISPTLLTFGPLVTPVLELRLENLSPYDNYQLEFSPVAGGTWSNLGTPFTPTATTDTQYVTAAGSYGFVRVKYVP